MRFALALVLSAAAFAYYPWVRYNQRGVYQVAPSKFDLTKLPNKTVSYFISENGPAALLPNDSVTALHSQIRAAAEVWNGVETSDLRLSFGGLRAASSLAAPAATTPAIDVVFEDLPPGVLSQGGPVLEDDAGAAANQAFIPIVRSVVILPRNFTALPSPCPCPSWSDSFFTTLVHEFGHALGLQHSFASSVMSQLSTRGTSKARPLGEDDVAGISWLYPTKALALNFGVISGRVTSSGNGVAYASVVALSTSGGSLSAITNPDGTYRIEGVPAGQYFLYTHSLPPTADVRAALDVTRREIPLPTQSFETQFFGGGNTPVQVRAGSAFDGVNFDVAMRRTAPTIYDVLTYSFPVGQVAIHPSHVNPLVANRNFVLAYAPGLTQGGRLVPGLSVSVLGGSPAVTSVRPYEGDNRYVRIDLLFNVVTNSGSHHLIFTTPTETYILPAGFTVVQTLAPVVTSVTPGVDGAGRFLTVTGTGFTPETRILVDGVAAVIRSFEPENQRIIVVLPPAPLAHRATVIAANPDGQTSLFAQSTPVTFFYDVADVPAVAITANGVLPAGVESLVEITGVNTNFVDGQVRAGFHTSDAVVRHLWVLTPTRLLANVWLAPGTTPGLLPLTVTCGLNTITTPGALQVNPANQRVISLSPVAAAAGTVVAVPVSGLAAGASTVTVTVNDRPANVTGVSGNLVLVQVPAGLPVGPAVLRLTAGSETSLPIAISVEPPPPMIIMAFNAGNVLVDAARPARPGDTMRLMVQGLSDQQNLQPSRVTINIAGIEHSAAPPIVPLGGAGGHEVRVTLLPNVPAGVVPVTIAIDGRVSAPFALSVRP